MQSLAIIGSGVAGLAAARFLRDRFDLTVFEQDGHVGGHANTVLVREEDREIAIDTGFMVFNHVTYPNLTRFFRELGVETRPTSMSFSVQHGPSGVEFNGGGLNLLFGQRRRLLDLRHWRMLGAIDRFNREALDAVDDARWADHTLGRYIAERGYGADMLDRYLVPMASAVWSAPPERMLDFPAQTLLRFWRNHGFLGLRTQHQWHTVVGGSRRYVAALLREGLDGRVQVGNAVKRVERSARGAAIDTTHGGRREFDKVILACHADQALALLADPTPLERQVLGAFRYQPNTATLHTDRSFMPRTRRCWASWNYRVEMPGAGPATATTHYWMNSLQDVSRRRDYFVSLNCHERVRPADVLARIEYRHPLFDRAAVRAQADLPRLNRAGAEQTTWFAGAWTRYGFHEDGFTSGLECARAITGEAIWS